MPTPSPLTDAASLASERAFHDQQAAGRACRFQAAEDFYFRDEDYLNHETWIRPAFALLGEVAGQRVLDLGCGHGMAGVVLARRGALVTGCDLSAGYLVEASRRARANGVSLPFLQTDAHRLPFADASFDRIWGNAVLHHLDLERMAQELHRVLRPGGRAVFCEPWGANPLLRLARRYLPYPGKERTVDEEPLRAEHLGPLRALFPSLAVQPCQFLAMARRLLPAGRLTRWLEWCDDRLLPRLPFLSQLCRYVILTCAR
jgi:SAM-dependent methyltransferase